MGYAYAKFVSRFRFAIVAAWIALVVAALLWLPQLQTVVSHQSTTFLPSSSEAMVASHFANQIDSKHKAQSTLLVAIRNDNGLTAGDRTYFEQVLRRIDSNHSAYGVGYLQDAANVDASVASSFRSKDKTTEIATIGLTGDITDPAMPNTLARLRSEFSTNPSATHVYFTGDLPIQEDDIQTSQHGAEKTGIVTVILVLIILITVFRSIVTPLVTLLSIGLSYLVTSGVVALLAEHGLPVSTFTQTFLIAVLFGAGTDYSIILLNRFREELTRPDADRTSAIAATVRGVGKTVLFSAMTVFISFAVLYFANFGLYRSAVGVSIGILITLTTCLTFIPALMSIFGGGLYWPRKPKAGAAHTRSRMWSWTAAIATRRPWWTLLGLAVVLAPVAALFTGERTFDPMQDIPSASSVVGFHQVSDSFGVGRVMPVNLILTTTENLRSQKGLAAIDRITGSLAAAHLVTEVDSATRPVGKEIAGFQLAHQNQQAAAGLKKVQSGMNQLAERLGQGGQSAATAPKGLAELASGSQQVTTGAEQLETAVNGLSSGSQQLSVGAGQLNSGLSKLAGSAEKIGQSLQKTKAGAKNLSRGLAQVSGSAGQLAKGATSLSDSQAQMVKAASELANAIAAWSKAHPGDQADPSWQQIQGLAQQLQTGTAHAAQGMGQLADGVNGVAGALPQLSAASQSLEGGLTQLAAGQDQLSSGTRKLATGAASVAEGGKQLHAGAVKTAQGAGKLAKGSAQVTSGIRAFGHAVGPVASGFTGAESGVQQLSEGVAKTAQFLSQSGEAVSVGNAGFYVPASAVQSNVDLHRAMDAYISPDGHVARFTVVLGASPYSHAAMNTVPLLKQAATVALAGSPIHEGQFYAGGTTATQAQLNELSSQDFTHTMILVFLAIFLLLAMMLRSILTPLYILVSLAATYSVTMGIVQTITVRFLHHTSGVSWAVPFFVFLLLVALGVDYSIFLMARFEEEFLEGWDPVAAIREAMTKMGNVVFAAALIMAGTFGSMTVAGMTTMVEIGIAIVIGLLLYTVALLAFFIPACATIIGRAHGWPLRATEDRQVARRQPADNLS